VSLATNGAIDCDIHPAVPGMRALLPYLDDHWREQIAVRGIDGLDSSSFPVNVPANGRADWRAAPGKPGSDLALLQRHALDAFDTRYAICNCLYAASSVFNADLAAGLSRAINEWLAREWLDRDARLRASIVVPVQDTELGGDTVVAPTFQFENERQVIGHRHAIQYPGGRKAAWHEPARVRRLDTGVARHQFQPPRLPSSSRRTWLKPSMPPSIINTSAGRPPNKGFVFGNRTQPSASTASG